MPVNTEKETITVLFDMDGTLLDTECYYVKNWLRAARESGYPMTQEQALAMRSMDHRLSEEQFRLWYGETADVEEVRTLRQKYMQEDFVRDGVRAKDTARETVEKLRQSGCRLAVVTASGPERTEKYLKAAGLYGLFDEYISASMVKRGKPAPDIYLFACRVMKAEPEEVYVVEDAPNGIRSAKAAGVKNIIMAEDQSTATPEDIENTVAQVRRLEDILPIILKK